MRNISPIRVADMLLFLSYEENNLYKKYTLFWLVTLNRAN